MSEAPLANSEEARTDTGEIKDVSATSEDATPPTTSSEESTDGKTSATKAESPKVPDKYEFKLPDGVKFEGEALTQATELFKKAGLAQDQAQAMVDFHLAQLKAAAEAPEKALTDLRNDWKSKAEADPDIGPHTARIKENLGRVFDALGNPTLVNEFKDVMNLTGVGDNPAFIKVLAKLAEKVVEPKHITGGGPSKEGQTAPGDRTRPSVAQALYPKLG